MDLEHYQPPPTVSYNGFLYKTASMARAVNERKVKEGACKDLELYLAYMKLNNK